MLLPRIESGSITVDELRDLVIENHAVLEERAAPDKGPVFVASSRNRLELLEALLSYPESKTELHQAVDCPAIVPASARGYTGVAKLLLDHGMRISRRSSPLVAAAHAGHLDLVEHFLNVGMCNFDHCKSESDYVNALEWLQRAVESDRLQVLEFGLNWLLPSAPAINEHFSKFYGSLFCAAKLHSATECFAWLSTDESIKTAFNASSSFRQTIDVFFYLISLDLNPSHTSVERLAAELASFRELIEDETLDLPNLTISHSSDPDYPLTPVSCCVIALSTHLTADNTELVRPILIDCLEYLLRIGCPHNARFVHPPFDPNAYSIKRDGSPEHQDLEQNRPYFVAGLATPVLTAVSFKKLAVLELLATSPQFRVSDLFGRSSASSSPNDALSLSTALLGIDPLLTNWILARLEDADLLSQSVTSLHIAQCISHGALEIGLQLIRKLPHLADHIVPSTKSNLLCIALRRNEADLAKTLLDDPIFNVSLSTHYLPGTFGFCVDTQLRKSVELMVARKNEFGIFEPFSEQSRVYPGYPSLLMIPSSHVDLDMLKLLVHEAGVKVEPVSLSETTHPFFPALSMGLVPVLDFFGSLGPSVIDFEQEGEDGLSLLHYLSALTQANEKSLCSSLRFLLSKVSIEFASYAVTNSHTPLIKYAGQGRAKMVRVMLKAGVRWQWQPEMVKPRLPQTAQRDQARTPEPWPRSAVAAAIHHDHVAVLRAFFKVVGANAFVTSNIHDAVASGACACFDFLVDHIFPWYLPPTLESDAPLKSYQRQGSERAEQLYAVALMYGSWRAIEHLAFHRDLIRYVPQSYLPEMRTPAPESPTLWKRMYERGFIGSYMSYTREETRVLLSEEPHRPFPYGQQDIHDRTLWAACVDGDLPLVKALYHAGADLDKFELLPHPRSALLCACLSGHILVARWLLSKGCTLMDLMPAVEPTLEHLGPDMKRLLQPLLGDI